MSEELLDGGEVMDDAPEAIVVQSDIGSISTDLVVPVRLGEEVEFAIRAVCVAQGHKLGKDGTVVPFQRFKTYGILL